MTRVDPNDPRRPYQQIADDLRRRIAAGDLAPGTRIEPTRVLATHYGVAPMTVHQAIRALREEGLVQSWQGRGSFVRAEGQELPETHAAALEDLRSRVDALTRASAGTDEQLVELRRQLARSQAHIMELYARAGLPYPHEDTRQSSTTKGRRRASGE